MMKKSTLFAIILLLICVSNISSQTLKAIKSESYFVFGGDQKFIQFNYDFEREHYNVKQILKLTDKDSIVLVKVNLNKYASLIDSAIIRDKLGRKLQESIYKDTAFGTRSNFFTPYSFFNHSGVLNGKVVNYHYLDELSITEKSIYSIENYKNGLKNGDFVQYFENIQKISVMSKYKDDVLEGEYIEFNSDGTYKWKGIYKKGLKHGTFIYYQPENKAGKFEQYENGVLHGQSKEWHENGNVAMMTNYNNGQIHGFYYTYYPNKQFKDSLTYDNGSKYGKAVSYYKDGKKKSSVEYKSGRMISDYKFWDESGQLRTLYPYKFGYLNGTVLKYFANGKLEESYGMKNDTLDGDYLTYYENGKVKTKAKYKMGKLQKGALYYDEAGKKMNVTEEPFEEIIPSTEIAEQEQIVYVLEDLQIIRPELKWTYPTEKNDLKLYKKIKGKEIQVIISKDKKFELVFSKDFPNKLIIPCKEMFSRLLTANPLQLNSFPYKCKVTFKLE